MPAGCYQIVVTGTCSGQLWQNVLHYEIEETTPGSPIEYAQALCDAFSVDVMPGLVAAQSAGSLIKSLKAKKVSPPGGPTAILLVDPGDGQGTRAAPALDTGVAALCVFPVTLNGKNVTGKIFVCGLAHDDVEDNLPTSGEVTALQGFINDVMTNLTLTPGGTAKYVVYNRAHNVWTHPPLGHLSTLMGTQRRRLHPN